MILRTRRMGNGFRRIERIGTDFLRARWSGGFFCTTDIKQYGCNVIQIFLGTYSLLCNAILSAAIDRLPRNLERQRMYGKGY